MAAGILFDHRPEQPDEVLRRVVDGRRADLHHISLVLRGGATGAERYGQRQAQCRGDDPARHQSKPSECHAVPPIPSATAGAAAASAIYFFTRCAASATI